MNYFMEKNFELLKWKELGVRKPPVSIMALY